MAQHDPHIVPRVPRLTGLAWPHVAPYLEEFLKRLLASSDAVNIGLAEISGPVSESDSPLASRRPTAHLHHEEEVVGLPSPLEPRRPSAHTHGMEDVPGALEDHDVLHLHSHPHTHEEIVTGAVVVGDVIDQLNLRRVPHTHAFGDLAGDTLTLDGDTILRRDFQYIFAMRNDLHPEELRIYRTYTSPTRYARLNIQWGGNHCSIQTWADGGAAEPDLLLDTPPSRHVILNGGWAVGPAGGVEMDLVPYLTDGTVSIGNLNNRVRALYVGGYASVVPIVIGLDVGQTANALEVRDSGLSNVLSRIDKDGQTTDWVLAGQIFGG